jgi:hypothetical protein
MKSSKDSDNQVSCSEPNGLQLNSDDDKEKIQVTSNFLLRWSVIILLTPALLAQQAGAPKPKATRKRAPRATTAAEIQSLKDALAAQQQQIQQQQQLLQDLKQQLQSRDQTVQQVQSQLQQTQSAASSANDKAAAVETATNQQKDSVSKLETDMKDVRTNLTTVVQNGLEEQKRVSSIEGLLGRFRFTGDMRVRGESFFQPGAVDRNRGRLRARLGVEGLLNDDFTAGIFLATGSFGDPTTTNETFTNFFDRKTVGIDRGYITYNPVNHKWLSLTGGKFLYTWNRTPVTFDSDLNPEGFSEKLSFDTKSPFLKNVTFTGIQMLFNEVSGGPDSFAAGGQASTKLSFMHDRVTMTPSFTVLNWHKPDAILQASAFAVAATTTGSGTGVTPAVGPFPVPGEGPGCSGGSGLPTVPPCVFAPNRLTNATVVDSKGVPHFVSRFLYADAILNTQIKTGIKKLPINLVLEYEDNLNAESPAPGVDKQSKAYGGDVSLGQTKEKNDFQFGYSFLRQEQDSVIASFNESDQRAPTNILEHKPYVQWKLNKNVTAAYTLWIGRTLNSNLQHAVLAPGIKPGSIEPYLKRMQFDLIYTF